MSLRKTLSLVLHVSVALFVQDARSRVSLLIRADAYSHLKLIGVFGDRILAITTGCSKWSLPTVNGLRSVNGYPTFFPSLTMQTGDIHLSQIEQVLERVICVTRKLTALKIESVIFRHTDVSFLNYISARRTGLCGCFQFSFTLTYSSDRLKENRFL